MEYDLFGMEATASFFWEQGIELPSDGQRLDQLQHLIAAGLGAHILVAQDICQKHRLCAYGGHGYEHIPRQIVPRMRRAWFHERSGRRDPRRQSEASVRDRAE